ncbi:MAG: DUF4124 domain-containing protein, partial [Telluria sp.]|nr:DUF4124 domain-containing protein [Telluria sp.]
MKQLFLAACCLFLAVPPSAAAIYRCTQPDGRNIYQEVPCDKGAQKAIVNRDTRGDDPVSRDELPKAGSAERRVMVSEAIASGQPLIGMTRAELDLAVGKPSRTKTRLDGSVVREQLFYGGDGFVELEKGTVVAIDSGTATKKEPAAERRPAPKKACLDEYAVRRLRIDIDNTYNRDNKELQKKLRKQ